MDEHADTTILSQHRAQWLGRATVGAGAIMLCLAAAGLLWVVFVLLGDSTYRGHFGGLSTLGGLALVGLVAPSALGFGIIGGLYVRVGLRVWAFKASSVALRWTGIVSLTLSATAVMTKLTADGQAIWSGFDRSGQAVATIVCIVLAAHGWITSLCGRRTLVTAS